MTQYLNGHDANVRVWNIREEHFISCIECIGEKRVRIDVFDGDDFENYTIYPVTEKFDNGSFTVNFETPLTDWECSYT